MQQLAASISLTADPNAVQETADRVGRLAVREGGFVQSSHVQVQQVGTSEANLALKLPSAKLGAALASLAQLAPVRGESQALQDITDTYDAAVRRLADANAERLALLRALGRATSEGQIDSLRERNPTGQRRDRRSWLRTAGRVAAREQRRSGSDCDRHRVSERRAHAA